MRSRLALALCAALTGGPACTLDSGDLDAFRETATGPQKLEAVLRDATRTSELRAEAALRLLDLERSDVDGRALLLSAFRATDGDSRRALVPPFERGLFARMRTDPESAPSPRAVRAKDLGVELLSMLTPEQEEQLGIGLLSWIGEDVERRADCGRFSLESIAAKVGSASALPSAESVRPGLAAKSLVRLSDTIEKHADPRMRSAAASKVVDVELSYRVGKEHQRDLLTHALPALGRFVDTEPARARLVAIASDPVLPTAQRELALQLLAQRAKGADVAPLASVALDEAAELRLRELALSRIGETGDAQMLPTLIALAADRHHRSLRQPATELAIQVGGERVLTTLSRTLPNHWNATYEKDEIDAYTSRVEALAPTPYLIAVLGKKLYSPYWWNRVLALRYLAARAHPLDATWRIRLHVDDKQEIVGEGWPAKWTVGREAGAALSTLAAR